MKRRVIKKNINRFITPVIKDLPTTTFRGWEEVHEGITIFDRYIEAHEGLNYTIWDGYIKPEGCYGKNDSNKLRAIKRTADTIKRIRSKYKKVYLRTKPEYERGHIYTRIITEKVKL